MPVIDRRQDYALWLKILKKGITAYGVNEVLAYYRTNKNSLSSNKVVSAKYQWKIYRQIENLSIVKSLYYFINYFINGLSKYLK